MVRLTEVGSNGFRGEDLTGGVVEALAVHRVVVLAVA